ncbi:MAG: YihY/virulence factor BrkB family protein [Trueperaceae bacterium]|nr:YihY/virulence factor BrkB family protein [Trueperaceae bacterium]
MRARLDTCSRHPAGRFVLGLVSRYGRARVPLLAASLAYYAAFALGPLLLLLGGWLALALRNRPQLAEPYREALTELTAQLLPLQVDPQALVDTSFQLIVSQLGEGAFVRSALSVLVLLWASSNFFASLQIALEMIFEVPSPRGFFRKRAVGLLLVVAVAVFVGFELLGGALLAGAAEVWARLRAFAMDFDVALPAARLPAAFDLLRALSSTAVFALAFRYLPGRGSDLVGALIGAVACTLSLTAMQAVLVAGFSFERVNLVYGVVTGVVVWLLWLYAALWLFLMGAVLAAEIARARRRARRASAGAVGASGDVD